MPARKIKSLRRVKYIVPRKLDPVLMEYSDLAEREGLFHGWSIDFEELDNGVGNFPVALIETEDGQIETVDANDVTFIESSPSVLWKDGKPVVPEL